MPRDAVGDTPALHGGTPLAADLPPDCGVSPHQSDHHNGSNGNLRRHVSLMPEPG